MTLAQMADRNGRVEDLAAFVTLDKAFQRAARRAGLVAVPFRPSSSVTARWAVAAATQADIAQIVRLTKSPMAWEEKPGGGWYVFLAYGADPAVVAS